MKILVYPPNKPPYTHDITTFKEIQDLVGGYVQVTQPLNSNSPIAVNEDGQSLNLTPNPHWPISQVTPPAGAIVIGQNLPYLLGTVVVLPADWDDQLSSNSQTEH